MTYGKLKPWPIILCSLYCFELQSQSQSDNINEAVDQTVETFLKAKARVDHVFGAANYNTDRENPPCQTKGDTAPQLVIIPRYRYENTVRTYRPFAIGRCEVTQQEFGAFLNQYQGKKIYSESSARCQANTVIADQAPATCINYEIAKEYTNWLSQKTGHRYRLPSLSEWRLASRAPEDVFTDWFSGSATNNQCLYLNALDTSTQNRLARVAQEGPVGQELNAQNEYATYTEQAKVSEQVEFASCNDGAKTLNRVAQYKPNRYGLYDLFGNVSEWIELDTCRSSDNPCTTEYTRLVGGNFLSQPDQLRNGFIQRPEPDQTFTGVGFRVVREMKTEIPAAKSDLNKQWQAEVYAFYESNLKNTFPFDKNATQNASNENIKRVFGQQGLIRTFYLNHVITVDVEALSEDEARQFVRTESKVRGLVTASEKMIEALFELPAEFSFRFQKIDKNLKRVVLTIGACNETYSHGPRILFNCTASKNGFYAISDVRVEGSPSKAITRYSGQGAFFRFILENLTRGNRQEGVALLSGEGWSIELLQGSLEPLAQFLATQSFSLPDNI